MKLILWVCLEETILRASLKDLDFMPNRITMHTALLVYPLSLVFPIIFYKRKHDIIKLDVNVHYRFFSMRFMSTHSEE